jgi:hypothetical protein
VPVVWSVVVVSLYSETTTTDETTGTRRGTT